MTQVKTSKRLLKLEENLKKNIRRRKEAELKEKDSNSEEDKQEE